MLRFGPSVVNTKASRLVKFKAKNMIERLEDLLFKHNGVLYEVPAKYLIRNRESYKNITIELIIADYPDYEGLDWLNVNYVMSDYGNFTPRVERSFWGVDVATPTYQGESGELVKIRYDLVLDEGHTFYEDIWNIEGVVELKEHHTNRGIEDKDGNFIPDLQNNPFIGNCDSFCERFNKKQEIGIPNQALDLDFVHLGGTTETRYPELFAVSGNSITKQVRGWVLIWADPNTSGTTIVSTIGDVAVPLKLFLFPVFDDFNRTQWLDGVKGIQTSYRIVYSNMAGDVFDYASLAKANGTGGGTSTSDTFRVKEANLGFGNFDKMAYNRQEIMSQITEPHLDALNHSHYELACPAKGNVAFDKLSLLQRPSEMRPPTTESEVDTPILVKPNLNVIECVRPTTAWNTAIYTRDVGEVAPVVEIRGASVSFVRTFANINSINFVDFINNAQEVQRANFELLYAGRPASIPIIPGGTTTQGVQSILSQTTLQQAGNPLAVAQQQQGEGQIIFIYHYMPIVQGDNSTLASSDRIWNNVSTLARVTTGSANYLRADSVRKTYRNISPYCNVGPDPYTNLTYNAVDIANPGNPDNSVLGYEITGGSESTKRYQATHWYVLYANDLYRLPIGQLVPKQYVSQSSDYLGYEGNNVILTKTIGYVSPEELSIKNALLNTDISTAYKVNNNVMSLNIKGSYSYPYAEDSYIEFMKNNLNQFNAGYANIESTRKLGEMRAGMNMLSTMVQAPFLGGKGAGMAAGGIINGITDLHAAQVNAENSTRTLDAQRADAKNMADNIGITGTSSTIADTIMRRFVNGQTYLQNYGNFWLPVIHTMKLTNPDAESVKMYYNKYGYKQDRMLKIRGFNDLWHRGAFNRVKINNPGDILNASGLASSIVGGIAQDLANGIGIWDIDEVDYTDVLDYTLNNYEAQFGIPRALRAHGIEQTIETETR